MLITNLYTNRIDTDTAADTTAAAPNIANPKYTYLFTLFIISICLFNLLFFSTPFAMLTSNYF